MHYVSKFLILVAVFCMALALALLLQIDVAALHAADALYPGAGAWLCLILVVAELLAMFWLYKALFARQSKLVLRQDATEEQRQAFLSEMQRRLARNSHVLAAGLTPEAPDFLKQALATLDACAEKEIRSSGKKVFLGTALAQNGRLDALIVFFSLCRMVWRISAIYNQRPTPREIWSVYSTVSSSTFVAFSIEALNIPQTIADALNELMPSVSPAMAASSVPFVGAAMHVFTASVIDGAANCLLAVRSGVITRRAYRYAIYGGTENLRSATVRDTGAILLDITQETLGSIIKTMKRELQDLSLNSGKKLVDNVGRATAHVSGTVVDAAADTVEAVGDGAQKVADCGKATVEAVVTGMKKVSETVRDGADSLGNTARKASSTLVEGAQNAGTAVLAGGRSAIDTAASGMQKAAGSVKEKAQTLGDMAQDVGDGVKNGLGRAGNVLEAVGEETAFQVRRATSALWNVLRRRDKKS